MRVIFPQSGHTSCTLLACSAPSRSTIPPLMLRCGFGRVWRLIMFTPSTITRFFTGSTFSTRPRLPLSLPVVTMTVSLRRMGVCNFDMALQHLGRERNNLHEPALAQFARDGPDHARADRLVLVVDQHRRVAIEADVTAVTPALLLTRAHNHGFDDLALLDRAVRCRFLHRSGDDVTEACVAAGGPANRVDHRDLPRAGVVGHVENRAHLDHGGLLYDGGLGHDLRHDPPLAARQRPRLGNRHGVAHLGFVLLVVRDKLRRLALRLAVDVVPHLALDGHDDGLVHLVADDRAGDLCFDAHFAPTVFSRRIVLIRARSRRTPRTLAGASSCPIDFWIRNRKISSSRSFSRWRNSSTLSSRTSPAFMMLSPAQSASRTWS